MNQQQHAKIAWSCRRGMKELDLILQPFYEQVFPILTNDQQDYFAQLLALDDLCLFACLFEQQKLSDPFLQAQINLLKQFKENLSSDFNFNTANHSSSYHLSNNYSFNNKTTTNVISTGNGHNNNQSKKLSPRSALKSKRKYVAS